MGDTLYKVVDARMNDGLESSVDSVESIPGHAFCTTRCGVRHKLVFTKIKFVIQKF